MLKCWSGERERERERERDDGESTSHTIVNISNFDFNIPVFTQAVSVNARLTNERE